jgi:uncharacterized membrane protein (UPF0127 family)
MTKRCFRLAAIWVCAATLLQALPPAGLAQAAVTTLTVRFFQITAEVADTPALRTRGLMGRQSLPPNHGMLFVFEQPQQQCFWMRNTPLPLTIAFLDDEGRISSMADMQPFSEATHCSQVPVRYALEMEQGWFAKRGIQPGEIIRGIAPAAGAAGR